MLGHGQLCFQPIQAELAGELPVSHQRLMNFLQLVLPEDSPIVTTISNLIADASSFIYTVQEHVPGSHMVFRIHVLPTAMFNRTCGLLPGLKTIGPVSRLGVPLSVSNLVELCHAPKSAAEFTGPLPNVLLALVEREHVAVSPQHPWAHTPEEYTARAAAGASGLTVPLKPYQAGAVAWLMWREEKGCVDEYAGFRVGDAVFTFHPDSYSFIKVTPSPVTGGLLFQEMGLGKTVEMLAIMAADTGNFGAGLPPAIGDARPVPSAPAAVPLLDFFTAGFDKIPGCIILGGLPKRGRLHRHPGGTLIVAPVTLCSQWISEIETKMTRPPVVGLHYGNRRGGQWKSMRSNEVVVTSYETLTADKRTTKEHRGQLQAATPWACDGNPYVAQLKTVPAVVEAGHLVARNEHVFVVLEVGLAGLRLVRLQNARVSFLHECVWSGDDTFPRTALVVEAVLEDVVQLPWKFGLCTDVHPNLCVATCSTCGMCVNSKGREYLAAWQQPPLLQIHWRRVILDEAHKINERGTGVFKEVLKLKADRKWCLTGTPMPKMNLKNMLGQLAFLGIDANLFRNNHNWYWLSAWVKDAMLRHTKAGILEALPGVVYKTIAVSMTSEEAAAYKIMSDRTMALVQQTGGASSVALFAAINGERMACSILPAVDRFMEDEDAAEGATRTDCPICLERSLMGVAGFPCTHLVCKDCLLLLLQSGQTTCPVCRVPGVTKVMWEAAKEVRQPRRRMAAPVLPASGCLYKNPSKLAALVAYLREKAAPALVFTQFNGCLDVLQQELAAAGFAVTILCGSQPESQRAAAVRAFLATTSGSVLISTLRAASFGLNLVHAKCAVCVDFPWNVGMESQAVGRLNRLGQTTTVEVVHLLLEGTVEARIKEFRTVEDVDQFAEATVRNGADVSVVISDVERRRRRQHQLEGLIPSLAAASLF
jgi:hypothetical protein